MFLPRSRSAQFLLLVACGLVAIAAQIVLAGWICGSVSLTRVVPTGTPMVMNTAICFLFAAAGYAALTLNKKALAQICGLAIALVGLLTFLQYPLHRSFGIDEFIFRQRMHIDVSGPGRMAPNTALIFVFLGVSLISLARVRWVRLGLILASLSLSIGLLCLCGYVSGMHSAFSWGNFTGMALPTAVCFCVISFCHLYLATRKVSERGVAAAITLPFFATGAATILVLGGVIYTTSVAEKTTSSWVQHSNDVIEALSRIELNTTTAESNVRGFLLSRNSSFIETLPDIERGAAEALDQVAHLTSDNPVQQVRVTQLRAALEKRFAFIHEALAPDLVRGPRQDAARSVRSRELTQILRQQNALMGEEELALRAQRVRASELSSHQLRATLDLGFSLILGLFTAAIIFTFRAQGKQALAERALQASNTQLEHRVELRTGQLKQSIEEAKHSALEARNAELQLRTILANSPVILWSFNHKGIFTLAEGKGLEALNLTPQSLVGTSHLELVRSDAQLYGYATQALAGLPVSGEVTFGGRYYHNHYAPLKGEAGQVTGVVGVSVDITSRRDAERLAIANESARESSRLKSEFLANMSHEIRTPMNGIIGMTALLLDTPLTADQREMTTVVQNSSESLLNIINEILDFSKIEAGKMRIEPVEFDLRQLVDETLAVLSPRAHEKHLELICDFDFQLPTGMYGDGGRIRQVITNLTGNAIKFTLEGEVVVSVRQTKLTDQQVAFRVEVKDSGVGISEAVQKTLFRPFEQGDSGTTRKFGGTGLGLAISRQLVELMVGQMGFASTPGQGSTFWFELSLPRATVSLSETVAPFSAGGHVLVVDDNATNRRILAAHLAKFGFTSTSAESATAALLLLSRQDRDFKLAILDWHMPGIDGVQLAREIRQTKRYSGLPIIMLSSSGADPMEAKLLGALVLTKPAREAQLRRTISHALSGTPSAKTNSSLIPRSLRECHILLVDDNPTNQLVGRLLLEKMGHRVALADDGQKAVEALQERTFDLVFMDCQMPRLNGYDATRKIRGGAAGDIAAKVPIVALTAYAMASDRIKCLEAGMDDYISKPMRVGDVSNVILRVLAEKSETLPPVPWDGTAVPFDRNSLAQFDGMVSDGVPVVLKLIELFELTEPKRLAAMKVAVEERSATKLAIEAHAMAGSCGSLGGKEVRARAHAIEQAAAQEEWESLSSKVSGLENALTRFHAELRHFL